MRALQSRGRWAASFAAACLLLLLLAQLAARLYPAGRLASRRGPPPARFLVLLPAIAPPADAPAAVPEPRREAPPAPDLPLREFWNSLVVVPDIALRAAPADTLPPVVPSFAELMRRLAAADTSRAARLEASLLLQNGLRSGWLRWGQALGHGWRAGNHEARKRSIFGEDWLEAQPLKEEPTRRR